MTALLMELDGETIPLRDVLWLFTAGCGCPEASTVAESPFGVNAATEDAAWREVFETARLIADARKRGVTCRPITRAQFPTEEFTRRCPHDPAYTTPPMQAVGSLFAATQPA